METATVLAITSISAIGIGVLGKVLYTLRHNVKSCWGIVFRSNTTSRNSPRLQELNVVRGHLENTLPGSTHISPMVKSDEQTVLNLENQIKIKELELKLRHLDEDNERIYI